MKEKSITHHYLKSGHQAVVFRCDMLVQGILIFLFGWVCFKLIAFFGEIDCYSSEAKGNQENFVIRTGRLSQKSGDYLVESPTTCELVDGPCFHLWHEDALCEFLSIIFIDRFLEPIDNGVCKVLVDLVHLNYAEVLIVYNLILTM